MLVASVFVACILALVGILHGLSSEDVRAWLSQPALSSSPKYPLIISPAAHLSVVSNPVPLASDSWESDPFVNGTRGTQSPTRLSFIRLLHGREPALPVNDSRHTSRIAVLVLVCLGVSASALSSAIALITKPSIVPPRPASDRLALDHNDTEAVSVGPRRSPRCNEKNRKLDYSTLCPRVAVSRGCPEHGGPCSSLSTCTSPCVPACLPQATLPTTAPVYDDSTSNRSKRRVFGMDVPVRARQSGCGSLSDIDDGNYLRDALGLIDWSDIPPRAGYWPTLDDLVAQSDSGRLSGWYLPDEAFRGWVYPSTRADRSDAEECSVAGEG
ncbi:hypothetical protein C8Q76DRAFT_703409 [Earliella scabrosa]|nr:hypothetical protein C8Q76DRAFT_703409 [Earliella scabrosa]